MKASFPIAATVTPQAPSLAQEVVHQDQTGGFRTALSLFLPPSVQNGMQAAKATAGASAANVNGALLQETRSLAPEKESPSKLPDEYPATQPANAPNGTGELKPGTELGVQELLTGAATSGRAAQPPNLPGPARSVSPGTPVKAKNTEPVAHRAGEAVKVATARQRSLSSQSASDLPPSSDVSMLAPSADSPSLQSPEAQKITTPTAAQNISPENSRLAPVAKVLPQASSAKVEAGATSAPTPSGAAYLLHAQSGASPDNPNGAIKPPTEAGTWQLTSGGSQIVDSQSRAMGTAASGPLTLKGSHNNTLAVAATGKPARDDEPGVGRDHAPERPRVSGAVGPHGTLAAQAKEILSPSAPTRVSDVPAGPASFVQSAAEFTRPNGATMQTQTTAQSTASTVLQKMDTAVPLQTISLRADQRHLDVGVQSSALGWIEVRATSGASGSVDATIHVQNDALARDIASHSGNIVAFAREHSVGVGQLSVGVGGGEGGSQEHGHRQQAAGKHPTQERGIAAPASPMDESPSISLISIRA
jgi:hypothetical protein